MAQGRHRWGRILLVLGLVVIVLLIAADRIGVVVAEREVGKQVRTQLASENVSTSADPSVKIDGFPFLTQVAAGHYDKITIAIRNPTTKGIRLDSLNVTATGVTAPTDTVLSGGGKIEADHVTGTAQIDWQSFQQLVDLSGVQQYGINPSALRVSDAGDGKIRLTAPISVAGQSFTALATGSVSVKNDLLHVKITNVTADGSAPPVLIQTLQAMQSQLTFDARVPALPYHLVLNSVTTNAGGVALTASASNVILGS